MLKTPLKNIMQAIKLLRFIKLKLFWPNDLSAIMLLVLLLFESINFFLSLTF